VRVLIELRVIIEVSFLLFWGIETHFGGKTLGFGIVKK
jgi:hypothetical protein